MTLAKVEAVNAGKKGLPPFIKRINDAGVLILDEVVVDNGRITKVISKLPNDPANAWSEEWTEEKISALPDFISFYSNVDGGYIGSPDDYKFFVEEKGLILIQKAHPTHNCCSIGYQPQENKWYGWSHRAIYGFTIGDVVKEGDLTTTTGWTKEYEIQHPEDNHSLPVGFKALTLNDAKRMAIAFAFAVS